MLKSGGGREAASNSLSKRRELIYAPLAASIVGGDFYFASFMLYLVVDGDIHRAPDEVTITCPKACANEMSE